MDERAYRWLDHTADLGMEVWGETLPGLFVNAARGLYELLGAPFRVSRSIDEELAVEGADREELLVAWLGEILFRVAAEGRFYRKMELEVGEGTVRARLGGGILPPDERGRMREIKAVTYHEVMVRKTSRGWEARVVFDV